MFNSVFAKYMTAFILIIAISFAILSGIVSTMIMNYSSETELDAIYNAASTVKQHLEVQYMMYRTENPELNFKTYLRESRSDIQTSMSVLVRYAGDLMILVTDTKGKILLSSDADAPYENGVLPDGALNDALRGYYQGKSDLGGVLPDAYMLQGMPIYAEDEIVGTVFTFLSRSATGDIINVMIKTIVMVCLWVMLAALIAVYFISERIIRPLKEISLAAKKFAKGKFDVRVPVIGHDEVAELAVAFNNMASSLAGLEEMRRTFLGNVSHDLRTPMTTIAGFIDGIIDGAIPEEKHGYYLELIAGEVKRLSRLVSTLLDISRIQAGDRKFNKVSFDICEMARLIVISFEQKLDEKKLDVEFDCDEENMFVYADRDAIYQVLYNICDNGVKFSRENGKYKIKLTKRDKKVFVSVYNEGQGIPEEELPSVFDRFYKSDRSRGLDKTGVGLGLYIAKTVMDAHGEEIWVKSVYGEYCEFVFTLQMSHRP